MSYFAVHYVYSPNADPDGVRPAHRAYLRELAEAGELVASGPLVGAETPGALLIMRADHHDRVADLLAQDPFAASGVIASRTITQWDPVIGVFAG